MASLGVALHLLLSALLIYSCTAPGAHCVAQNAACHFQENDEKFTNHNFATKKTRLGLANQQLRLSIGAFVAPYGR